MRGPDSYSVKPSELPAPGGRSVRRELTSLVETQRSHMKGPSGPGVGRRSETQSSHLARCLS